MKFIIGFSCSFEEELHVLRFELWGWVYKLEVTLVLAFICVALTLLFGLQNLSFFLSHSSFSLNSPFLKFKCLLLFILHFLPITEIEQLNGVMNQVLLDLEVQWRICRKRRSVVHFENPRLKLLIDEYVKA